MVRRQCGGLQEGKLPEVARMGITWWGREAWAGLKEDALRQKWWGDSLNFRKANDLYAAMDDNADAVLSYKKSLSFKETSETRKKLEKLQEK